MTTLNYDFLEHEVNMTMHRERKLMVSWRMAHELMALRRSEARALPAGRAGPMIGENRQLVKDAPVEVQDCRKITDYLEESMEYTPFNTAKRRMSTCNRLDLQTLWSQLVMSKNLPDHWAGRMDSLDRTIRQCNCSFGVRTWNAALRYW